MTSLTLSGDKKQLLLQFAAYVEIERGYTKNHNMWQIK